MAKRRRRRNRKRKNTYKWFLTGAGIVLLLFLVTLLILQHLQKNAKSRADQETSETEFRTDLAEELSESADTEETPKEPEPAKSEPAESEPVEPEPTEEELLAQKAEEILEAMTLEEKVCQLFIVTPEQLTGASTVTAAGETTKNSLEKYPVAGLIYFSSNLISKDQTMEMLANTRAYGEEIEGMPLFLCVDEEGGRVARIGNNAAFQVERVKPMAEITDETEAYEAGVTIGSYLHELGFNLDFAPDADVLTNDKNTVIGDRSFGQDPKAVTRLAAAVSRGLKEEGMLSTFKHFPGHGSTEADTHKGYAYTQKSCEELKEAELVPFEAAQEQGVDLVMAAHISVPDVTGDDTPSSLSYRMITEILRGDLGFEGLVVTDALNMGAVSENYEAGETAVMAVEAGIDLLLMPKDFDLAREGIVKAVSEGRISEGRIDASVRRIIEKKLTLE